MNPARIAGIDKATNLMPLGQQLFDQMGPNATRPAGD